MSKIIVIEGTDGCGKETQTKKLVEYLKGQNINVVTQDFPNYASESCAPVKMLLNGELGSDAKTLDAYQSSTLFAVDRLCTFNKELRDFSTASDAVLVLDRYVESNLLYQASKIDSDAERSRFVAWLFDLEYNKLKLPKPDMVIYLNVPPAVSLALVKERGVNKNGQEKDIYESNNEYMQLVYTRGLNTAKANNWTIIDCLTPSGTLKSIDEIHNAITAKVSCLFQKQHKKPENSLER